MWVSFVCVCVQCFFFKQKTAYEMRISDGSSDVFSSDLRRRPVARQQYCPIRVGSCRNGTYREHEGKRDCDGPCRCPLIVRLLMARAASGGSKGPRRCIAERAQSRP